MIVCKIHNSSLGTVIEIPSWERGVEIIKRWAQEQNFVLTDSDIDEIEATGEYYNDEDSDNIFTFSIATPPVRNGELIKKRSVCWYVKLAGADLSETVKGAKDLTEIYNAVANAIGAEAWRHYEALLNDYELKTRRALEQEMAPWTELDVDLLKRLQGAATLLNITSDPVSPWNRLAGIIQQMDEVRKRADRGW